MLEPEEIQDIIKRFKVNGEDDNCRFKEIIKQRLLNNRAIIHFLNSPNLDEDCPDDYFGVVIKPEYMIPQTQSEYKNFICPLLLLSLEVLLPPVLRFWYSFSPTQGLV